VSQFLQDLKYKTFGRLGSFWERNVDEETLEFGRRIVQSAAITDTLTQLLALEDAVKGKPTSYVSGFMVGFDLEHMVYAGPDLNARFEANVEGLRLSLADPGNPDNVFLYVTDGEREVIDTDGRFIISYDPSPEAQSDYSYYFLPRLSHITPYAIRNTAGDVMVAGIDFQISEGLMRFSESPAVLFPDYKFAIIAGERRNEDLLKWVAHSSDVAFSSFWQLNYASAPANVQLFHRALNEYCGRYVAKDDMTILSSIETLHSVIYNTSVGAVEIGYDHDRLPNNTEIKAGEGINLISVHFSPENGNPEWFREVTGSDSVNVSYVLPGRNIRIEHGEQDADVRQNDLGKLHVRPALTGAMDDVYLTWRTMEARERVSANYLADTLAITTVGPTPLDFKELFLSYYERCLVLLDFENHADIKDLAEEFIRRERPANTAVVLVRDA